VISTEILSAEAKQQLVLRVADSTLFRKSPRLREFLLYAADCTLEERLGDVREQIIAEKVFQRKAESYDFEDSIVRAEARNLRKRLEKYFETEGLKETVLVTMPKGGYALAFEPRPPPAHSEITAALENVANLAVADPGPPPPQALAPYRAPSQPSLSPRILRVAVACLACLATLTSALALRWYPGRLSGGTAPPTVKTLPFSALFSNRQETFVVTSDTSFLQTSELEGRRLTLDDYLVRAYPDIPHLFPPDLIQRLNRSQYTDGAEMTIAGLIMRRNAKFLQHTYLRSGRQLALADFKSHNIVLLGSPVSNPWADLYANQLNFQFDFDSKRGITFRNRAPRTGELPTYPVPQNPEVNRTYAQVAFLPSTSAENGSVLLLGGTTAEATGAAGEFLLSESGLPRTLTKIGIDPTGPPRYFEILLRATTFIGGATQSEVIAYRLHPYSTY